MYSFAVYFSFFSPSGFRSFVPICSSKTSCRPSWSKSCQHSQRNHGEGASTLPRTKPKTYSSPTLSAKPSISIFPARKPNSSPTLSTRKPKPSVSLHPPASQLTDPSPLLHHPQPSVSPTLTVPTPRLSPSPTSLCRGMSMDSPGGKQPSPVAKERCARSISISNTKVEPRVEPMSPNEARHDVLDQEALMDFTHPALRRVCSMTCKESRRQTYSESQRQAAMSQNSFLLQGNVGTETENSDKDKPKPPPRNIDITAILKPNPNIKQQQEFLPSGATGKQTSLSESEGITFAHVIQRKSQSVLDGLPIQSSLNLHRKCIDYPQSRTGGFGSNEQSYEQVCAEKSVALPVTPPVSFSTERFMNQSTVLPNTETRRRQFGFNTGAKEDATFLSGSSLGRPLEENNQRTITGTSSRLFQQTSASQNIKSPQKHRFWPRAQSQNTQMGVERAVSQSDCVSKDYRCQSRDISQKMEAPQCAHRLDQFKTCLVAPHTQEAFCPASVDCTTSKTTFSKSDIITHKHQLAHEQHPGKNKSHNEVNLSDTGVNQTAGLPTKLPECPSEKCVVSWPPSAAQCPFNTNSSKGVFDLPFQPHHRVYQRPDETTMTASPPRHQPNYSPADRAFIMEEAEDTYYVTMYYPGSVYVGEYTDIQTAWQTLTEQIP